MLCDQFAELQKTDDYLVLPPEMRYGLTELGKRVQGCNRFVLDRSAVQMIQNISLSSPKTFNEALQICKLPYPRMWVEFAYKDRDDWMREQQGQGMVVASHQEAGPPSRLGFYIEQKDSEGRVIELHPVWTHVPPLVNMCFSALTLNTSPLFVPQQKRIDEIVKSYHTPPKEGEEPVSHWVRRSANLDDVIALESRISVTVPEYVWPLWNAARKIPNLWNKMAELARFDLRAEWSFVLALLTVLNSRNVVEYTDEVSYDALNKSRAKKGKPPLLAHREIRLNLSKVLRRRMGETGPHASPQAHLVRGHWKLRKSGLYWWSAHVRGEGAAPEGRTYRVTA